MTTAALLPGAPTIEALDMADLLAVHRDVYRDVFGCRPRGITFESREALLKELDNLTEMLEYQEAYERQRAADAEVAFEKRVVETMNLGAKTREDALRWIVSADQPGRDFYWTQDVESYVYMLDLLFTDYGRKLVQELMFLVKK